MYSKTKILMKSQMSKEDIARSRSIIQIYLIKTKNLQGYHIMKSTTTINNAEIVALDDFE